MVSFLHHFLENHNFVEVNLQLHADNCARQNINHIVLQVTYQLYAYEEVLTKELKSRDGASTYAGNDECVDEIIGTRLSFMLDHDVVAPADNEKLPSVYWLPKLHKNPRFIAASSACTTRPVSKLLTQCLKLVLKHYSQYGVGTEWKMGINCFGVVKNSTNSLPKVCKASHLDSLDFSTLYTKYST